MKRFSVAKYLGFVTDPPMERAVAVFNSETARLEQAQSQRQIPTIRELKQMEWESTARIVKAYLEVGSPVEV